MVNDADGIAKLFGFAHHMRGEEHGFALSARHSRMKSDDGRAALMTSSPEVGSSKIITGGSWISVRAMETRCFMPVESSVAAAIAEVVHLQPLEERIDAPAQALLSSRP